MTSEDFTIPKTNELQVIQRLVARVRTAAYQGMPSSEVAALLDDVQYLLSLQTNTAFPNEKPDDGEFDAYLQNIESRYPAFVGLSQKSAKLVSVK